MYEFLRDLDRRVIFSLMAVAVAVPILLQITPPEKATPIVRDAFETIEALEEGDRVYMAFDFDPASAGELQPMATAFVRHACEKKLKIYFTALWPVGPQFIKNAERDVISRDFPEMVYGEDYVDLGFKTGNEGVIKLVANDLRTQYPQDARGTPIDDIPMMAGVASIRDFDVIMNVSAGYPGTKEWVQYAVASAPDDIKLVAGCTGVQAPLLYPYYPQQMSGLLAAIKGAAEYESLVLGKYGRENEPGMYQEGLRRMAPQLSGHILMVGLIFVGNLVYFMARKRGEA